MPAQTETPGVQAPTTDAVEGARSAPGTPAPLPPVVWMGADDIARNIQQSVDGNYRVLPEDPLNAATSFREFCIPLPFFLEDLVRRRTNLADEMTPEPLIKFGGEDLSLHHNNRPMTRHAASQLAYLAQVPIAYFNALVDRNESKLAVVNVNMGLIHRQNTIRNARNSSMRLRYRDEVCRAVVTSTYGVFDNDQAFRAIVQALPAEMTGEVLVSQYWTDGNDVTASLLLPDRWIQDDRGIYSVGMKICNSEIGTSSFCLYPYLYNASERTGFYLGKGKVEEGVIQMRHYGEMNLQTIQTKIEESLALMIASSQRLLSLLHGSRQIAVSDPAAVMTVLGKLSRIPQETARLWWRALNTLPDNVRGSAYSILHALMLVARDLPGNQGLEIEGTVASLLSGSVSDTQDQMVRRWQTPIARGQQLRSREPADILAYLGIEPPPATPAR